MYTGMRAMPQLDIVTSYPWAPTRKLTPWHEHEKVAQPRRAVNGLLFIGALGMGNGDFYNIITIKVWEKKRKNKTVYKQYVYNFKML